MLEAYHSWPWFWLSYLFVPSKTLRLSTWCTFSTNPQRGPRDMFASNLLNSCHGWWNGMYPDHGGRTLVTDPISFNGQRAKRELWRERDNRGGWGYREFRRGSLEGMVLRVWVASAWFSGLSVGCCCSETILSEEGDLQILRLLSLWWRQLCMTWQERIFKVISRDLQRVA